MSIEELLFQKNELKNIETIVYPKFYESIISSIIVRHKNNITASLPVFKLLVDNFPDSKEQVISFVITEYKK